MKSSLKIYHVAFAVIILLVACKKNADVAVTPTATPGLDTSGTLKNAADFPIGFAIDYTPFKNDLDYRGLVVREADNVTFTYNMKHGAIARDDGSFNYAASDELFNLASSAGLAVFGHTLVWHENQNANYLKTLTVAGPDPNAPNIITNGNFEAGTGNTFTNWSVFNSNGATISTGSGAGEVRGGTRSLKIVNPNSFPTEQWKVQVASDLINTTVNKLYKVSFWIKSFAENGSGRLSTQPTAQYQNGFSTTTEWTEVTWSFTARDAQTRILFDMGAAANTYFIDDVTVIDASSAVAPNPTQVAAAVDTALSRFIRSTATHYAGRVKAWDVVNEVMADGVSGLRTSVNSPASNATDRFYWADYLGRNFALKAFNYARAADPTALLFINDYNLEFNPAKLDSTISYVKELQGKGAKIDGIGTQMHITINTSRTAIDNMFQKLAATGLLIRVSELDIRVNPNDAPGFTPTAATLASQGEMYKYVVQSYVKYVPAPQRHGITVWGINDKDSWIVAYQKKVDFPLLFNDNYTKKPAYYSFLLGLKGK
jgi:endo-1,4-beta-xylanase